MVNLSRRDAMRGAALALLGGRAGVGAAPQFRIGVTDWNLRKGADPDALPLARKIGFEGVQISFGRKIDGERMPADHPEVVHRYLSLARESKIAICGTCVDRLHDNGLKSDPQAPKWVEDSIRLTKAVNGKVLLLPFFGKWALATPAEMEHTGDVLRELAPEAEKAGVILGIENTISAEDNVRIMERSRAKNVLVYYDTGNSTNQKFDILKEIRWLGKDRICQIHLKDNPNYLGEGSIDFPAVVAALKDIGYRGWAVLETDVHQGSTVEGDMAKNLAYLQKISG